MISAWGQSLAPSKQHKLLSAFGTCGHDDHVKPLTYGLSVLIHVQWHRPSQDAMSHVPTGVFLQPLTISVLNVAGTHGGDEKITLHGLKLQVAQGELLGICGEVRHAIFLASFCNIVLYASRFIRTSHASLDPISDPDHPSCILSGSIVGLFSPRLFPCVPNCCIYVVLRQCLNGDLRLGPHSQTECRL